MTQITFQPALDALHTVFRLLRMRDAVADTRGITLDHLRIIDFYLAFPHRLAAMRLKSAHRWIRTVAKQYEGDRPYGGAPDDRSLFERMQPFQMAAFETLVQRGFYLQVSPQSRQFRSNVDLKPPSPLENRIAEKNSEDAELLAALGALANEYSFYGTDGLKDRTGLMDYRHDAI